MLKPLLESRLLKTLSHSPRWRCIHMWVICMKNDIVNKCVAKVDLCCFWVKILASIYHVFKWHVRSCMLKTCIEPNFLWHPTHWTQVLTRAPASNYFALHSAVKELNLVTRITYMQKEIQSVHDNKADVWVLDFRGHWRSPPPLVRQILCEWGTGTEVVSVKL